MARMLGIWRVFALTVILQVCASLGVVIEVALAQQPFQSDANTIALWHFDEGQGNILHDVSGNGNDATIYNSTWVQGRFGGALSFNGVNSYAEATTAMLKNVPAPFTVEVWVMFDEIDPNQIHQGIVGNAGGYVGFWIQLESNGHLHFWVQGNGLNSAAISQDVVPLGQWILIKATYDGQTQKLYMNNELVGTANFTQYNPNAWRNFNFGRDANLYLDGMYFKGKIDEVRISRGIRGTEPCRSQFQVDANTVALWHFDEGQGSILHDATSNHNDGVVNGPTWVDGVFGKGLSFDGINDSIPIPHSPSLSLPGSFTIELYLKTTQNVPANRIIIDKAGDFFDKPDNYRISIGGNFTPGLPCFGTADLGLFTPDNKVCGTGSVADGNWHYLAAVRDASYSPAKLRIYVDCFLVGESDEILQNDHNITNVKNVLFGTNPSINGGAFYQGILDEVRISNVARSFGETGFRYSGIVTNPTSGQLINEATVALIDPSTGTYETRKTSNGYYEFTDVQKGQGLILSASKLGYVCSFQQSINPGENHIEINEKQRSSRTVAIWGGPNFQHPVPNWDDQFDQFKEDVASGFSYTEFSPFALGLQLQNDAVVTSDGLLPPKFRDFSHEKGILLIPSTSASGTIVEQLLNNETFWKTNANDLVDLVVQNGWDGIDIDYELFGSDSYQEYRQKFSSFIQYLYDKLHSHDKLLTIAVQPSDSDARQLPFDYAYLAMHSDELRIMCYDMLHYENQPNSHAWLSKWPWQSGLTYLSILEYCIASKGIPASKIVIGIPTYGYFWLSDEQNGPFIKPEKPQIAWENVKYPGTVPARESRISGYAPRKTYSENGKWKTVVYEDMHSLGYKLDALLDYDVQGLALFAVGSQDPRNYQVIQRYLDGKRYRSKILEMLGLCPIELTITDPNGARISNSQNELGELAEYREESMFNDENPDVLVEFHGPVSGNYALKLLPRNNLNADDTFSIIIIDHGVEHYLVKSNKISQLPSSPLIYNFDLNPPSQCKMSSNPATWFLSWLNSSTGTIRCLIGNFVPSYSASLVIPSSIRLNGYLPIYGGKYRTLSSVTGFTGNVLEVAFDRIEAVKSLEIPQAVKKYQIYVTGNFTDGRKFVAYYNVNMCQDPYTACNMTASFDPIVIEEDPSQLPSDFSLSTNYPNPFNATTQIQYALPRDAHVTLTIYNILGQKARTLVDEEQSAGYKQVIWDGTNESGDDVGSGVYFYRIQAGDFTRSEKMVLLR